MNPGSFTEEDKQKFIDFLNIIAKNATFNGLKTEDIIKHFQLLAYMQQSILPKITANILEISKVVEAPLEEPKKEPKKAK